MSSSVVYCSLTGNTKKIAEVVANELGTTATKVRKLPENWEPGRLVVIGTGVYGNRAAPPLIKWLYNSPSFRGRRAAVFVTAGNIERGKEVASWLAKVLEAKGAKVKDAFVCSGSTFWLIKFGHPNAKEILAAKKFANKIAPRTRPKHKTKTKAKPKAKTKAKPKPKPRAKPRTKSKPKTGPKPKTKATKKVKKTKAKKSKRKN